MSRIVPPGSVLGVLGGGQLGRMFAIAAHRMGYHVEVFVPDEDTPTGQIAHRHTLAAYDDLDAVRRFAAEVAVVTLEFENIPAATAEAAASQAPLRPSGQVLHRAQHRLREKDALTAAGVPTVGYAAVETEDELAAAVSRLGTPCILKTAAWGYDGKGQARIDAPTDASAAWDAIGRQPAVLEAFAPFVAEISVVGVRGVGGEVALYDPFRNQHAHHILDVTVSPAGLPDGVRDRAREIARTLLEAWEVVGVLCVELFLMEDGELLVNEVAPRPHNSGHLTIDAHVCDQFEQQVRAVCGLPLGSTEPLAPACMANVLGDRWERGEPDWAAAAAVPGVRLHLYGKRDARPERKMGHLTALARDVDTARSLALRARAAL